MNSGKKLEKDFVGVLDNKYYDDLNQNLKQFITFIFKDFNHTSKIYGKKLFDKQKADFAIKIDNNVKYISLKSCSQNSVHVEKIEKFRDFLLSEGVKQDVINNLLLYNYGDVNIGTWCTSKELLDFCIKHKSMYINTSHFSVFTYQNWCRNVSFAKKSELHRDYIQIKWFSILSDIRKIRQINDS